MSDFCDFVPDDPSCQVEPEEPVINGGDGPMEPMDEPHDDSRDHLMANVQFLIAAISGLVFPAMWVFRYRAATVFDTVGDTATTTNYWLLLDNLANYPAILIHLVLTITQALSMAGIAVEVNMMAWHYGGMLDMVLGSIYFFGLLFAYQQYHDKEENGNATEMADAELALSMLEMRSYMMTAWSTHTYVMLYRHYKDWMEAQWNALPEETKGKYHEDYEDDMKGEEMISFFRF